MKFFIESGVSYSPYIDHCCSILITVLISISQIEFEDFYIYLFLLFIIIIAEKIFQENMTVKK